MFQGVVFSEYIDCFAGINDLMSSISPHPVRLQFFFRFFFIFCAGYFFDLFMPIPKR